MTDRKAALRALIPAVVQVRLAALDYLEACHSQPTNHIPLCLCGNRIDPRCEATP